MVLALIGKHIKYKYAGLDAIYEAYYQSEDRIVYRIHGGPMVGRSAYQKAYYQQIDDDIYMISWVEEIGTVVNVVLNLPKKKVYAFLAFSKGHWEHNVDARGDKRDPKTLARWRELSKVGSIPSDMIPKSDHADIIEITDGPGDMEQLIVSEDLPVF